jgi:predicted phosphodiesterase
LKKVNNKVLVLGDSHFPFQDWQVLEQAAQFKKDNNISKVIQIGDLTDSKALSRFLKDPDDDSAELEWSKVEVECKKLSRMFPEMTILPGNHDLRYIKKAKEAGIPKQMVRTLHELFPFKGWKWHLDPTAPYIYNNNAFLHGDQLSGTVLAKAKALGMNVIQGHTHKAAIEYHVTFNKMLWGMDVGCMVDPKTKAFDYAASKLNKVWVGFGYIDESNVPHLIPKKK